MIFYKSSQAKLSEFCNSKKLPSESSSSAHSGETGTSGRTEVDSGQLVCQAHIEWNYHCNGFCLACEAV